jgi:hypothetical protein
MSRAFWCLCGVIGFHFNLYKAGCIIKASIVPIKYQYHITYVFNVSFRKHVSIVLLIQIVRFPSFLSVAYAALPAITSFTPAISSAQLLERERDVTSTSPIQQSINNHNNDATYKKSAARKEVEVSNTIPHAINST